MRARLEGPLSLQQVYDSDVRASALCKDLQVCGFGFDKVKALELTEFCKKGEEQARARVEEAVGHPIKRTAAGGFSKLNEVFFGELRAPKYYYSALTGRPSLDGLALSAYASSRDDRLRNAALGLLDWRSFRKIRKTYLENVKTGPDGRVHPSWFWYGAISGRWAARGVPLMTLPRLENDPTAELGGVRTVYIAEEGKVLVAFDCAQLEIRVAAYASGDKNMISHVLSGDVHAMRAGILFGKGFTELPKKSFEWTVLRNITKTFGLAVNYLAEANKVHSTIVSTWPKELSDQGRSPLTMRECEIAVAKLKRGLLDYFRWQDQRLLDCIRTGYTTSPILGRRRWLGFDPSPTECANFPIQSGAADIMNERLPRIWDLVQDRIPNSKIVAQVHDSGVFEVPENKVDETVAIFKEVFDEPVRFETSGLSAQFPVDVKASQRWS